MILFPNAAVSFDSIKATVAQAYGVKPEDFNLRGRRIERISVSRMVAMTLCLHAGYSTTHVAREFNRCDHTASVWAKKRVMGWYIQNPKFADALDSLANDCGLEPFSRVAA